MARRGAGRQKEGTRRVPPNYPLRAAPAGDFRIHPRRWVVGRAFAWPVKYRRSGKDHEFVTETSEAMIYAAMIRRTVRRLDPFG